MAQNKGNEGSIDVEVSESVALGSYSNLAIISHSHTEFVVDFASLLPGMPKAKVSNRIVLTPEHAKRLLYSLQENIARYESNHGVIEIQKRETQPTITPLGEA